MSIFGKGRIKLDPTLTALREIKTCIAASNKEFSDLLGVSEKTGSEIIKGLSGLTAKEIDSLSKALDLSPELIVDNKIDYVALSKWYHGDKLVIPEKYAAKSHMLSRARGVQTISQYLTIFHGYEYTKRVFRRLQINPAAFYDITAFVSPLIGIDLLTELSKDGFSEELIRSIGTMSLMVNSVDLGQKLEKKGTPRNLYESWTETIIPYYDRVFDYRLDSISDDGCAIVIRPKEEIQDMFRVHYPGDKNICLFKQGVCISFLANIKNRYAKILESECMYTGASQCKYHLSW